MYKIVINLTREDYESQASSFSAVQMQPAPCYSESEVSPTSFKGGFFKNKYTQDGSYAAWPYMCLHGIKWNSLSSKWV